MTTLRRRNPPHRQDGRNGTTHNNNNSTINHSSFAFLETVQWPAVTRWLTEASNLHFDLENYTPSSSPPTGALGAGDGENSYQYYNHSSPSPPPSATSASPVTMWQKKVFQAVRVFAEDEGCIRDLRSLLQQRLSVNLS